jgi:hypothetical protein
MIPLNTPALVAYNGNDITVYYPITFPTFEAENVTAYVEDAQSVQYPLNLGVEFNVSSIGIPNTYAQFEFIDVGQVWQNIGGALKSGYSIIISFTTNASQPAKFRDLGRFAPEAFEKALDRLTMNVLALDNSVDTALVNTGNNQAQIDALIAADVVFDSRIDAIEISDTAQNLTLVDHESRIDALESTPVSAFSLEVKSANFAAAYYKTYIITAAVDVQLPVPVLNGRIEIKISSLTPVNILRNGGEKIDFVSANKALVSSEQSVTLVTDGTDWYII